MKKKPTLKNLQARLFAGNITCVELVQDFLKRIAQKKKVKYIFRGI